MMPRTEQDETLASRYSVTLRRFVQRLLDLAVLISAFVLAYLLRFDFDVPPEHVQNAIAQLPFVVALQYVALILTRVQRCVWRYFSLTELRLVGRAALLSALPLIAVRLAFPEALQPWRIPLSIIMLDTLLASCAIVSLRVLRRVVFDGLPFQVESRLGAGASSKPVFLIGAGSAGAMAVREIQRRAELDLDVKGFIDDDPGKQGATLSGIDVLGTTRDLPDLIRRHRVEQVVVAIASATPRDIRRIVEICNEVPVKVRAIPGLYELLRGNVDLGQLRDLQMDELLQREPVRLDELALQDFIASRTVMITGAGGSIGSELCRQVSVFRPGRLLLIERAEAALFEVDRELRSLWPELDIVPVVGDVGNPIKMRALLEEHRPHVVVHAAAHKHVPLMESNVTEAMRNNALATKTLAELAGQSGTEVFVLVSTDKAVCPTSIMGASKRLAELVIQDLDKRYDTRFLAVRFGNVMGSAGSVIPIFQEQIRRGRVTVTHADMTRYFLTIPEASQLVLQASAMGKGGEIFILDMGEPVRILDLARNMIKLCGLEPDVDVEIVFTGVRPGEKLSEELSISDEDIAKTRHAKIYVGKLAPYPQDELEAGFRRLRSLVESNDGPAIRRFLNQFLPEAQVLESSERRDDSQRLIPAS